MRTLREAASSPDGDIVRYTRFDEDQEGITGELRGHSTGITASKRPEIYSWLLASPPINPPTTQPASHPATQPASQPVNKPTEFPEFREFLGFREFQELRGGHHAHGVPSGVLRPR